MANETGKRYTCSQCGSEFLVTRGGQGQTEMLQANPSSSRARVPGARIPLNPFPLDGGRLGWG